MLVKKLEKHNYKSLVAKLSSFPHPRIWAPQQDILCTKECQSMCPSHDILMSLIMPYTYRVKYVAIATHWKVYSARKTNSLQQNQHGRFNTDNITQFIPCIVHFLYYGDTPWFLALRNRKTIHYYYTTNTGDDQLLDYSACDLIPTGTCIVMHMHI